MLLSRRQTAIARVRPAQQLHRTGALNDLHPLLTTIKPAAARSAPGRPGGRRARPRQLDHAISGMDADEVMGALATHFTLHPFPIVVESLRFNFRYVLEHGYRAFYQMTAEYLAKLAELLAAARQRLLAMDLSSVPFPPWELFTLDLNMIEVPAHCDSCRVVASYGEYALDQPPAE